MKKGLLIFTGIIELIFFILVLLLSLYNLAYQFLASTINGFIGESFAGTLVSVFDTMYKPLIEFVPVSIEAKLLNIIVAGLMIVVSLMLLIFATKKLSFARLPDFEYLQKRRSLRVFMYLEFIVFAAAAGTLVLTILDKDFKFDMLEVLPQGVNAVVMLILFFFSLIQIMRMSKAYKRTLAGTFGGVNYNQQYAPTNYGQQQYYGDNGEYVQAPEPPRYQPNMIDNTVDEGDLYAGYPDKVKADLERLDRLHANGALTEDSFQAMRTKILQEFENANGGGNTDPNGGYVDPNTGYTDPNGNPPHV